MSKALKLIHNQSKINIRARGSPIAVKSIRPESSLGIMLGRTRTANSKLRSIRIGNQGKLIVETYGLNTPQRLTPDQIRESDPEKLRFGTIVKAMTFSLQSGSRTSRSYWLPPHFPPTENSDLEFQNAREEDIHVAWIEPSEFSREELILPLSSDAKERVNNAENGIALASQIYANSLIEMANDTKVVSPLEKVTSARIIHGQIQPASDLLWKASVTWQRKDVSVAFVKLWRNDAPVQVYASGQTRSCCAKGTVVSVNTIGT